MCLYVYTDDKENKKNIKLILYVNISTKYIIK